MSLFTSIDLSELPPPSIVEELDYETILTATKTELQELASDLDLDSLLESDPINKLLEVMAYRELHLRQRVNEAAKGVMLATATGSNLDHLAALVNIQRLVIDPGDSSASIDPIYESDERLRTRTQLAFEGFSTAGPQGAYVFHSLSASAEVKDVVVYSELPGQVEVKILSGEGDGSASAELLGAVESVLNSDEIRPITDLVQVQSADIVNYTVDANLILFSGVGAQEVLDSVQAAAQAFIDKHHNLGVDITRAGLFSALYQPGVQNVELNQPASDILISRSEAPFGALGSINYVEHPTTAPYNLASTINFINESNTAGGVSGSVIIGIAGDEHDITHYALYWGANNAEKLPCGAKNYSFSGAVLNLDHDQVENLLMTSIDGKTIYIEDHDFSIVNGVVTALNAAIEEATVRISYGLPVIADISIDLAESGYVSYTFTENTSIPAGATHFIVFTKNEFGEMLLGISASI